MIFAHDSYTAGLILVQILSSGVNGREHKTCNVWFQVDTLNGVIEVWEANNLLTV